MKQDFDLWEHHCLKCDYKYRSPILHSPCRKCRRYNYRKVTGQLAPFDEPQTCSVKEWKELLKRFHKNEWTFKERAEGSLFCGYLASDCDPYGMYLGVII